MAPKKLLKHMTSLLLSLWASVFPFYAVLDWNNINVCKQLYAKFWQTLLSGHFSFPCGWQLIIIIITVIVAVVVVIITIIIIVIIINNIIIITIIIIFFFLLKKGLYCTYWTQISDVLRWFQYKTYKRYLVLSTHFPPAWNEHKKKFSRDSSPPC